MDTNTTVYNLISYLAACHTMSKQVFYISLHICFLFALRWRHNDHDGVSNHQPHGCLLNRLFRRRSKQTSKRRVTGLCVGNSPGPVNSPHKGPVTRKMFAFDDVIMGSQRRICHVGFNHYPAISQTHSSRTKQTYIFVNRTDKQQFWETFKGYIDGLTQDCNIPIANVLDILQPNIDIQLPGLDQFVNDYQCSFWGLCYFVQFTSNCIHYRNIRGPCY